MSSAGLNAELDESAGGGGELAGWLKNLPVGKYIASVLDFFSLLPTCISNPICANVLFIMSRPLIISSLVAKRKDPSSR